MSEERPMKRIRQACENCRRKKARCPGEKPTCSYCSRLGQLCEYADEHPAAQAQNQAASTKTRSRMEERMEMLEAKLAEVIGAVKPVSSPCQSVHGDVLSSTVAPSPTPRSKPLPTGYAPGRRLTGLSSDVTTSLPSWDSIVSIAELYLLYCDCQPLPLFDRDSFITSLENRDPEVLLSMLALASRFSKDSSIESNLTKIVKGYVNAARRLVNRRVSEGPVELSTLQTLCLLSLVDFTNGDTQRSGLHSTLAMDLAHCSGLTRESNVPLTIIAREERRRCFWSIFMLKRLHGADFTVLDFSGEENFPWYPKSTGSPSMAALSTPLVSQFGTSLPPGDKVDAGIVAYTIQLSEVWFKTTKYGRRRAKESKLAPWSPQSEYATIMAQQMDFETRVPYIHRFKPAAFSSKTSEELQQNRDYWGPWLFIQFLYHTNLCLLNHPLLLSLRLKTLTLTTVIPEIFLQHTSDLISSHASWIIHYIDMLEAKSFKISDPFLGHCAAIVATIHLQESFREGESLRKEKHLNFAKCLKFIRDIGEQWPHISRIADKLQRLEDTVSATYRISPNPQTPNRGLLIDLALFWEILEYSTASELSSSNNLFGASLQQGGHHSESVEVSNASALPEPTRLDTASRQQSLQMDRGGGQLDGEAGMMDFGMEMEGGMGVQDTFLYSNDELAVLAESFFQQRNGNIVGSVDEWWNTGNL